MKKSIFLLYFFFLTKRQLSVSCKNKKKIQIQEKTIKSQEFSKDLKSTLILQTIDTHARAHIWSK